MVCNQPGTESNCARIVEYGTFKTSMSVIATASDVLSNPVKKARSNWKSFFFRNSLQGEKLVPQISNERIVEKNENRQKKWIVNCIWREPKLPSLHWKDSEVKKLWSALHLYFWKWENFSSWLSLADGFKKLIKILLF